MHSDSSLIETDALAYKCNSKTVFHIASTDGTNIIPESSPFETLLQEIDLEVLEQPLKEEAESQRQAEPERQQIEPESIEQELGEERERIESE
jgi:hypothetical protein